VHEIASQRLLPVHAPCQGFLKARSGEACPGTKPPTCAKRFSKHYATEEIDQSKETDY